MKSFKIAIPHDYDEYMNKHTQTHTHTHTHTHSVQIKTTDAAKMRFIDDFHLTADQGINKSAQRVAYLILGRLKLCSFQLKHAPC